MSKPMMTVNIETEFLTVKNLLPREALELRDILLDLFPLETHAVHTIPDYPYTEPFWYSPIPELSGVTITLS